MKLLMTALLVLIMWAMPLHSRAEDQATVKDAYAMLDGAKIHYQISGDLADKKNTLVFVHGWAGNLSFWKNQTPAFADMRVITLDLPGHGQSAEGKLPYSMSYFAEAVDAVMKDSGTRKATLVGHSLGTPIIRQYYRLHPNKVKGLVIVDGALRPYESLEATRTFTENLRKDYKKVTPALLGEMLKYVDDDTTREFIVTEMAKTPEAVGVSAMETFSEAAIWNDDKINVPVLAVMAEPDSTRTMWPADNEAYYKTVAPVIDYVTWKNVSHFLMMERPKEFNYTVKAFLIKEQLID